MYKDFDGVRYPFHLPRYCRAWYTSPKISYIHVLTCHHTKPTTCACPGRSLPPPWPWRVSCYSSPPSGKKTRKAFWHPTISPIPSAITSTSVRSCPTNASPVTDRMPTSERPTCAWTTPSAHSPP